MILYNIPSRTGVNLTEAQYAALADIPNIRAVKEASGNMAKLTRLCADGRLAVYSGSDDQILPVAALNAYKGTGWKEESESSSTMCAPVCI